MHKGGDGDADEEKVEGAHHIPHVCRMMTIKYIILKEEGKEKNSFCQNCEIWTDLRFLLDINICLIGGR